MDAGVEFEAVDFLQANRLTIHIMAAVAEHEAKAISERTKAALASLQRCAERSAPTRARWLRLKMHPFRIVAKVVGNALSLLAHNLCVRVIS
jgi:DNA invertase Pin-like site-specific DNA recombinase